MPAYSAQPRTAVLHVIDTLELGGAEMHCIRLAAALDPKRFEVHLAYGGSGLLELPAIQSGLRCFRFRDRPTRVWSIGTFFSIWRLYRYIKKNKIALVHTYLYSGHVLALLAALVTRTPVIEHVHDLRYENLRIARQVWHVHTRHYRLVRFFHSFVAKTLVLTPDNLAAVVGAEGEHRSKCVLIANGVPAPPASVQSSTWLPTVLGFPADAMVVIVAGGLLPHKDVSLALRSFAKAFAQVDRLALLIAGDGPLREELQTISEQLGIEDRVRFIGPVFDVSLLLPHCVALLHTSHIELNSLAILEAMRCGVPVIARWSVSGNRLLIRNGHTGRLIASPEDAEWAAAIVEVALDAPFRSRLGLAARRDSEDRFAFHTHVTAIETIYDSVLRAHAA